MSRPSLLGRRTLLASTLGAALLPRAALAAPFASTRLTVTTRGEGPDVILIHGLDSSRAIWNGTMAALAGYRAHLIQIGGFSGAPVGGNHSGQVVSSVAVEIARYIAEAKLFRPALIGHSMGGTIAMMVAARWSARVGRLMVVDMLPQPAGMIGGTASGMGPFAQQLQRMFGETPQGRDNFASLMRMFSPPGTNSDPDMTGRVLSELAAIDMTPELPRIVAPMTVVFATPRPGASQIPAQVRQTFTSAYARARTANFVPIADSGHMVMLDQPARFNQAVRRFLADR